MSLETPVLFLVFNRPDTTQQVFEVIRKVKPKKLFVAADGPRLNKAGEKEKCEETRLIATQIDWDCELITLFRSENLGCGRAVSEAITWFFEHVEEGIILEDDCLPEESFFIYCKELLNKFRYVDNIMQISGNSFVPKNKCSDSYYFSKFPFIWGWATWRRAWVKYDFMYHQLASFERKEIIERNFSNSGIGQYWQNTINNHIANNIKMTWDYQWFFTIWKNDGLVVLPKSNLVSNLGFREDATHTSNENSFLSNYPARKMFFPLRHPKKSDIVEELENTNFKMYFSKDVNFSDKIYKKLMKVIQRIFRSVLFRLVPESRILFNENVNWNINHKHDLKFSDKVKLYPPYSVSDTTIGDYTYIAQNSMISNTVIGKFCSVGPGFLCGWGIHPTNGISTSPMFYSTKLQNGISFSFVDKIEERKIIKIGNDVFIGANVTVLDGVEIGDGAVIGAGAVVSKNIPPYAIAVGCPIQVVKNRFDDQTINRLLTIKWWEWSENDLKNVEKHFFDVESFLNSQS